jgi:hypothetical protein
MYISRRDMIIDHIDELSCEAEAKYGNELISLAYLSEGLRFLYRNVSKIEQGIIARLPANSHCFLYGAGANDEQKRSELPPEIRGQVPSLDKRQLALVACSFHWYAVSAYNYALLVGWLASVGNSTEAKSYAGRVLGPVSVWRHKVGAHFAQADPRLKEDSMADLAASVMFPIAFDDDAFYAQPFTLVLGRADKKSTSRNDMRWSLTHTHRALAARYWPDVSLT